MTNEWLDDATARRAAYEWTEAKDEETGLRLMREVLPPLVLVRELRAVEAERNKLRARVAELEASRPTPAPVAADAGLTDEECDGLAVAWFGCSSSGGVHPSWRENVRRAVAKYLELRPQPARLRMPTVEEANELANNFDALNRCEWTSNDARLLSQRAALIRVLRTLGADLVESAPSAQVYTYNPTTGVARSREQAATGEPDYWTRLEHQYVAMHWTENAADELFAEARRMSAEARRRVEGEEACK